MNNTKIIEVLLGVTKSSINGVFNIDKYVDSFLNDDLERVIVIRSIIEENTNYAMSILEKIDSIKFKSELIEYAKMLFCKLCLEERGVMGVDNFDDENLTKEDESFFNYIYKNLQYPDLK